MEALITLMGTAAMLGTLYTLAGPDHYVPFVVISKARNWNVTKTVGISLMPMTKLHRYSHALAGASIFICGLLIHMGL